MPSSPIPAQISRIPWALGRRFWNRASLLASGPAACATLLFVFLLYSRKTGDGPQGEGSRHLIPVLPKHIFQDIPSIPDRPVHRPGDILIELPEISGVHCVLNDFLYFIAKIIPILISHILPPFTCVNT